MSTDEQRAALVGRMAEAIPARGELGIWTWQEPEGLVAA